jgi:hypothetical protein
MVARHRRLARSTIDRLAKSKKVPDGLRAYWAKQLAKKPKAKVFVVKRRKQ